MKQPLSIKSFVINIKSVGVKMAGAVFVSCLVVSQAVAGWSVNGSKVIDPRGNNFIFRGINHAHAWYPDKTAAAMTDIAATGANSVRVVLANGAQWTRTSGADVAIIIGQCKAAKLVCVLEVHDSTGFGESSAATNISNAAAYWASSDIKSAIIGQEDYVIVNIANEPYGNGVSASTFTTETSAAIKTIRNAGLTHLIMVDAPNWGQDWSNIMRDNAATIFAADSLSNTMFSVHMYEVYNTASNVQNYLTSFQAKGFALIVGEFGTENNGKNVDEVSILLYTQQMGIGYMGWSWSGNGSCCVPLDIATNWNPSALSTWGNLLINGANGIKATSKLATHFGTTTSSLVASSKASSKTSSKISSKISSKASIAASSSSRASVVPASSKATIASAKASSSRAGTAGLSCSYVVTNNWGTGFTAAIRVTNSGSAAVSSWAATWTYASANRVTNAWNAVMTGSNPYVGANVGWNGNVGAGQTVEFGFQGASNGASVEKPTVTCQ